MRTQLLCTFASQDGIRFTLSDIQEKYNLVFDYIYILQSTDNNDELYVTYNIEDDGEFDSMLKDTISVHRKKETNTIYTINALNEIIKHENNGILDKSHIVNWNNYRNSILLTSKLGIKQIPTKIYEIINI